MSYEVWEKSKLATRKGLPDNTFMTLDMAMDSACTLSKGSKKQSVYNPKKKNPGISYEGGMEDVDIPNAYCVVDKDDKQSRVRGWGIGGRWYDARHCKRCNDTGQDVNVWGEPCSSCKGASYKPKV